MEAHAHAGQRRFQLVADRGDEVRLHFVQQPKPGDILEDHGRAEEAARLVAHADDTGSRKVS
jgi:hypothetical protein